MKRISERLRRLEDLLPPAVAIGTAESLEALDAQLEAEGLDFRATLLAVIRGQEMTDRDRETDRRWTEANGRSLAEMIADTAGDDAALRAWAEIAEQERERDAADLEWAEIRRLQREHGGVIVSDGFAGDCAVYNRWLELGDACGLPRFDRQTVPGQSPGRDDRITSTVAELRRRFTT